MALACNRLRQKSWSPLSQVWQHVKLSDVSLEILLQYSPVVDEDVKKANKQKERFWLNSPFAFKSAPSANHPRYNLVVDEDV